MVRVRGPPTYLATLVLRPRRRPHDSIRWNYKGEDAIAVHVPASSLSNKQKRLWIRLHHITCLVLLVCLRQTIPMCLHDVISLSLSLLTHKNVQEIPNVGRLLISWDDCHYHQIKGDNKFTYLAINLMLHDSYRSEIWLEAVRESILILSLNLLKYDPGEGFLGMAIGFFLEHDWHATTLVYAWKTLNFSFLDEKLKKKKTNMFGFMQGI